MFGMRPVCHGTTAQIESDIAVKKSKRFQCKYVFSDFVCLGANDRAVAHISFHFGAKIRVEFACVRICVCVCVRMLGCFVHFRVANVGNSHFSQAFDLNR